MRAALALAAALVTAAPAAAGDAFEMADCKNIVVEARLAAIVVEAGAASLGRTQLDRLRARIEFCQSQWWWPDADLEAADAALAAHAEAERKALDAMPQ